LTEVERVDAEIIAAMSSGDWEAYHDLMTGQVRWMVPGGETLTGWNEIGPFLGDFGQVLEFTYANRRFSGSGDVAYRTMDFVMVTSSADPDVQLRYPGKMLTVFHRQEGKEWLVEVEIWNTSPFSPSSNDTSEVFGEELAEDGQLNTRQMSRMLDLFDSINAGGETEEVIDDLLRMEGTSLIICQMNLVRSVTPSQYEEVLHAVAEGREPVLTPQDTTARARAGVRGLLRDVWPNLLWGIEHRDSLRAFLRRAQNAEVLSTAVAKAEEYLPEPLSSGPRPFLVLGGRAGAAALSNHRI
jgi:ketosteroid isomerase-like protein